MLYILQYIDQRVWVVFIIYYKGSQEPLNETRTNRLVLPFYAPITTFICTAEPKVHIFNLMRKCTHCNSDVEEDALFCTSCGKELPKQKKCIKCGKAIDEDSEWCTHCGTKQAIEYKEEDIQHPQQQESIEQKKEVSKSSDLHTYCETKQVIEDEHLQKETTYQPKKNKNPMLIIVLLLVVFLGGGAFFFFHRQISESNSQRLMADSIRSADSIAAIEAYNAEQQAVAEQTVQEEQADNSIKSFAYKGDINNKYQIVMSLQIDNNDVIGTYYYVKNGSNNFLKLYGTIYSENDLTLEEYSADHKRTGIFEGKYSSNRYYGTFTNYKGEKMPFEIYRAD